MEGNPSGMDGSCECIE